MNKKLLVLGGTTASLDVVRVAQNMGVTVFVADDQDEGVSKSIADFDVKISTTDYNALVKYINENKIDGVFCGPSEFNLQNCMKVCELMDFPFYFTSEQWEICSNKKKFKQLCDEFDVPRVKDYEIKEDIASANLNHIEYPVIVKPVDGASSIGISVCYNEEELRNAYDFALRESKLKEVLVEHYIDNNGVGLSARYIICDGKYYLSLVGDRYVVNAKEGQALIGASAFFPSKYTDDYIEHINENAIRMFKALGIRNGTLFMQALIEDDNIYFHEMGLRLSGGLTYKMTEDVLGVNDLKMMIRYALGLPLCTQEEKQRISPYLDGKYAGSLSIPLKPGIISKIVGVEKIKKLKGIVDFTQYYQNGSEIDDRMIGTLMQLFGRIKITCDSKREFVTLVNNIHEILEIRDQYDTDMIYARYQPVF